LWEEYNFLTILDKRVLNRMGGKFQSIVDAELPEDAVVLAVNRLLAKLQIAGDLADLHKPKE
tara:strand:+ start:66 stop:251 length:186 start_codon:yes stop_codon:yes gene_type:complete